MIKSSPSLNVTECSLLALVISTVPNFYDIIRMTVFPPRASFQRTYRVATTALMSRGKWEHPTPCWPRSSTATALCRLRRRFQSLCAHPELPYSGAGFRSIQLLPDHLTNHHKNQPIWKDTSSERIFLIHFLKCNFTEFLNLNSELQHQIATWTTQGTQAKGKYYPTGANLPMLQPSIYQIILQNTTFKWRCQIWKYIWFSDHLFSILIKLPTLDLVFLFFNTFIPWFFDHGIWTSTFIP